MSPVCYRTLNTTFAYVTIVVFTDGLNNNFIPRKESEIFLFILILTSRIVQILTFLTSKQKWCPTPVWKNALFAASRPSFLRTIKDTLAKKTVNKWLQSTPGRKITRLQLRKLSSTVCDEARKSGNGKAGFAPCGIYLYFPNIMYNALVTPNRAVEENIIPYPANVENMVSS
jgi:hypothetical protein